MLKGHCPFRLRLVSSDRPSFLAFLKKQEKETAKVYFFWT